MDAVTRTLQRKRGNMTNFEWLLEEKRDYVKECLATNMATQHEVYLDCGGTACARCRFFDGYGDGGTRECCARKRAWLDAEYIEPCPLEVGDIVRDDAYGIPTLGIVNYVGDGFLRISSLLSDLGKKSAGQRISHENYKKLTKIGHYDGESED